MYTSVGLRVLPRTCHLQKRDRLHRLKEIYWTYWELINQPEQEAYIPYHDRLQTYLGDYHCPCSCRRQQSQCQHHLSPSHALSWLRLHLLRLCCCNLLRGRCIWCCRLNTLLPRLPRNCSRHGCRCNWGSRRGRGCCGCRDCSSGWNRGGRSCRCVLRKRSSYFLVPLLARFVSCCPLFGSTNGAHDFLGHSKL